MDVPQSRGMEADDAALRAYYERGIERERLSDGRGDLEFTRSKEVILRLLLPRPAVVADIGGGPGRYTHWLAGLGYQVEHRDLMPLHVAQVLEGLGEAAGAALVRSEVGDALDLDLGDACVDAVLLLGPLYHLRRRADRVAALREAGRIVRPGGPVFAAAISRWAPRLDGLLRHQLHLEFPKFAEQVGDWWSGRGGASRSMRGRSPPTFTGLRSCGRRCGRPGLRSLIWSALRAPPTCWATWTSGWLTR